MDDAVDRRRLDKRRKNILLLNAEREKKRKWPKQASSFSARLFAGRLHFCALTANKYVDVAAIGNFFPSPSSQFYPQFSILDSDSD